MEDIIGHGGKVTGTTSITVRQSDSRRIDTLAGETSKKDFITAALDYFEKYGINPLVHESPAQEMQKLIKRVDQVVAFIRKQEADMLRPMCEAVNITEQRIKANLQDIAMKSDVKSQAQQTQQHSQQQARDVNAKYDQIARYMAESFQYLAKTQAEGFAHVARLIDAKEKTGVLGDIAKTYEKMKR
jgi:hypothetical protein